MRVVVLGASPNKERFSNMVVRELLKHGHDVIPVNPGVTKIAGLSVVPALEKISGIVDTLTVYIGPEKITPLIPAILTLKPSRVILNPGTESSDLKEQLYKHKIPYIEACTLVMLRTKSF